MLKIETEFGERDAYTHLPVSPKMAVVMFHPACSNGKRAVQTARFQEKYPDLAIMAPNGIGLNPELPASNATKNPSAWSTGESPCIGRAVDDVAVVDTLLDLFLAQLPKDTPLYLVGHSNGVAFGYRYLFESRYSAQFKAYAAHTGEWVDHTNREFHVPVLHFVALNDKMRPMAENMEVSTPWFDFKPDGLLTTLQKLTNGAGAVGLPSSVEFQPHWTIARFEQGKVPLEWVLLHGQGHNWQAGVPVPQPPAMEAIVGPNNPHVDATELTMEFFRKKANAPL